MVVVFLGIILYAFLKGRRERLGQVQEPAKDGAGGSSEGLPAEGLPT